jgi:hypothetical protein
MIAAFDTVFALAPRVRPPAQSALFYRIFMTLMDSSKADTVSALSAFAAPPA